MRNGNFLSQLSGVSLAIVFLFVFSCGGGLGGGGADEPMRTGKAKYDSYFEKAEKFEAQVKEAKASIEQAQADLAISVGLDAEASLDEIKTTIREAIESAVIKAGAHVEVKIEGGIFASGSASASTESGTEAGGAVGGDITVTIEIVGDVEASADVQKIIDAAKVALQASAELATKLKPIALEAPDLVAEAAELQASVTADFDPIMAVKVTARITGLADVLKQVTGVFDASFDFTLEVQASFSVEASAEAEAGAEAGTE